MFRTMETRGSLAQRNLDIQGALANPIQHARSKLRSYSMRDLGHSWVLMVLGLWHAYLFWTAGCVVLTMGANEIVKMWVGLYMDAEALYDRRPQVIPAFLVITAKSWIWISVIGELVRFCFVLGRDALRVDGFEAYRRALLGLAAAELREGALYSSSWPQQAWSRKAGNFAAQVLIYFSLDVFPAVLLVSALRQGSSWSSHALRVTLVIVPVACAHVLLHFAAWTLTDVAEKVALLRKVCRETATAEHGTPSGAPPEGEEVGGGSGAADRVPPATEAPGDASDMELGAVAASNGGGDDSSSGGGGDDSDTGSSSESSGDAASGSSRLKSPGTAESLNLCVFLCWACIPVRTCLPHIVFLAAVVYGIVRGEFALIVGGLFWAVLLACYAGGRLTERMSSFTRSGPTESRRLLELQAWGETCCALDFNAQFAGRAGPFLLLTAFGIIFAVDGWWSYLVACMAVQAYLVLKQAVVNLERPWGWLVGIAEGVVFALGTALLDIALPGHGGLSSAAWVCVLSVARQFGLRRRLRDGMIFKHLSVCFMCVIPVIILWIVCKSVSSGASAKSFTKFCNASEASCKYTAVPYRDTSRSVWPQCSMRFPDGDGGDLALSDFGLFSSLAYESEGTIARGLEAYFPGWRIDYHQITIAPNRQGGSATQQHRDRLDWTTFYEFTDPANTTSVFAVRGTQYLVDVVMDIGLWLPATIIGFFEKAGPNFPRAFVHAVAAITSASRRREEREAFAALLERVLVKMRAEPSRRFYITGHSLGGGVAKLVSASVAARNLSLPAVVFAAPGLSATSFVVYGQSRNVALARTSLTVQPDNDVVSRVDTTASAVVPVACNAGILPCHDIFRTLCNIFKECGSMRTNQSLAFPMDCSA